MNAHTNTNATSHTLNVIFYGTLGRALLQFDPFTWGFAKIDRGFHHGYHATMANAALDRYTGACVVGL